MRVPKFAAINLHVGLSLLCFSVAARGSPQDDVAVLLQNAEPAIVTFSDGTTRWTGQTVSVSRLDNGVVLVKASHMTLDTDGASQEIRACDKTSQPDTALTDPQGKPTDANVIPYIVLPWCGGAANRQKCRANPPHRQLGLRKGNLAAVVVGDKIAFAIAADLGPEKRFGEGSVALHRQLGHETVGKHPTNPRCAKDESLNAEVVIVVFPGSNERWLPAGAIAQQGSTLWNQLLHPSGR
jgi:hypothetical protein